jgi:hypothetical protein
VTRMFIRHQVKDYVAWRKAYDAFDPERTARGVIGHQVFRSIDDPDNITVWHDFPTPQAAKAFASSDRLKVVMHQAGVEGSPEVWFVGETF